MSPAPWHTDPDLRGRFHPEYPSDLQVVVHDGEPRRTGRGAEACWVRVTGVHGTLRMPRPRPGDADPRPDTVEFAERAVYVGELLNAPAQLATVAQGDALLFVATPGLPHPLRVSADYLAERPAWIVTPCTRCGADQGWDPPTVMAKTRFPSTPSDAVPEMFTAFCLCGGTMVLQRVDPGAVAAAPPARPWWKFW